MVAQQIKFREKRRFCDFNWLPWQCPLRYRQMNTKFIKPLHSSTNPEILVKIRSVVSEIDLLILLRGRLLKNMKKLKKK